MTIQDLRNVPAEDLIRALDMNWRQAEEGGTDYHNPAYVPDSTDWQFSGDVRACVYNKNVQCAERACRSCG